MISLQVNDEMIKNRISNSTPFKNKEEFDTAYRNAVISRDARAIKTVLYRGAVSGFVHISCPSTDSLI